jgi:branched-chain amino acid transport system ATP-binding protein
MLGVENLQVVYDRSIEAVRGVSMHVSRGQIVALLGSNGAGKSTILKAISGVLAEERGEVIGGKIEFQNVNLEAYAPDRIVASGLVQVPEGRALFDRLTVEENLLVGGYSRKRTADRSQTLDQIYELFPSIASKRHQTSGYLSGGEQQMVAIGRALMSQPRLLMLDEPSLGLAPRVVEMIFEALVRLNREVGVSVLLVEQNARLALSVASYCFILENGRVVMDGAAESLSTNPDVKEFYLGFSEAGHRKSIREVKHYKRRKRWLA